MGTGSSTSTKPAYEKSYDAIRGSTNNVPSIVWPATGALVSPTNFLGILRDKTAIDSFDLPTDTQREYFCRAGTETVFNDGSPLAKYTGTEEANNGNTNMYLNALGWYKFNCSTLHPVGEKLANAWGIFDTHGNIYEWCLDYSAWKPGEYRILRGGCYLSIAENCRSAYNAGNAPSTLSGIYGFRLVMTLTTN
jgi:formylglycine-generating enzyme required for sulfatase activity